MINHIWIAQSTTIVLILLSCSFVDNVQCLEMNLLERDILMHHLNSIHSHQITRRQAPTSQDLAYCNSITNDAYCSSGFGQRAADIDLSCGDSIETVRLQYARCARSESGGFCRSLIYINSLSQRYLEANCSGAITSNTCPPQCRTNLEDFKSKLGCCINAYLNGSYYYYLSTGLIVDYRLWNLCGVPLPAMDCQSHGLTFNVPASAQNCTSEELTSLQYAILCQPNIAQPYINGLLKDTRCSQINLNYSKDIINACSMNPRGEFCFIQTEIYRNGSTSDYVSTLNSNCDSEISNLPQSGCRLTCRNELVEIKDALGCCVNYYNRSYLDYPYDRSSLAYGLWASCGVETPGFCESKLSLNRSGSGSGSASTAYAMQWAFAWTVFAIVLSIFNLSL